MILKGGFYLKSRAVQDSKIMHAPPHTREIWDYLLMSATHQDGRKLKRGQVLITAKRIREALFWYVGYRKEYYKLSSCENALKWLRKAGMIDVTRTTRGSIITICNYSLYQDPKNYGSQTSSQIEKPTKTLMVPNDRQEGNKKGNKNELARYGYRDIADRYEGIWGADNSSKGFSISGKYLKAIFDLQEENYTLDDWEYVFKKAKVIKKWNGDNNINFTANLLWFLNYENFKLVYAENDNTKKPKVKLTAEDYSEEEIAKYSIL